MRYVRGGMYCDGFNCQRKALYHLKDPNIPWSSLGEWDNCAEHMKEHKKVYEDDKVELIITRIQKK